MRLSYGCPERILIKNGTIIDGTGNAGFVGSLLIEGDHIADVIPGNAPTTDEVQETIDASGCFVTPGFIDAHSHSDAYLILEPSAASKISQGITTEINGQCGGSIAPRFGEARLSGDWATLLAGKLTWRTLSEYRSQLEKARPAVNTVQFVGHNTLRSSAMGYEPRSAGEDDLKKMTRLLEEAMDDGAWGLTTGLIYQPGRYALWEEVLHLAKVAASHDGFYATHMRSEGDRIEEAIDEVVELARLSGVRAEISHLKTSGRNNWGKLPAVIDKIERAMSRGLLLGADRYPFTAAGTDLDIVLPDWAQAGAAVAEMERFASPVLRRRIVEEIDGSLRDWREVMIGGTWHDENKKFSGLRVSEVCGSSPGEFIVSLLEKDVCKTGAFFFGMSEENLDKILSLDWIVPGSDASLRTPWGALGADHPHPRAYATMPEFFRRLRSLGVTCEEAVKRMTSLPAGRFEIRLRGELKKGYFADVAVWKENEFSSRSTYSKPHAFSSGMQYVIVNGKISYRSGRFTDNRGGRFLERRKK